MTNLLVRRRNEMMPWFDEMFGDFWNRAGLPAMPRYAETALSGRALMDVVDKGDTYEVKVDMPRAKRRRAPWRPPNCLPCATPSRRPRAVPPAWASMRSSCTAHTATCCTSSSRP